MKYCVFNHRDGLTLAKERGLKADWKKFGAALASITDSDLISRFEADCRDKRGRGVREPKSLSHVINDMIDERVVAAGWHRQVRLFPKKTFPRGWTMDFASHTGELKTPDGFSCEVAFNHSEALAWILTKSALACERNVKEKQISTRVGLVVTATQALKDAGNFDGAIGTFESVKGYLDVMHGVLTAPIVVIGLEAPRGFVVDPVSVGGRTYGKIRLTS